MVWPKNKKSKPRHIKKQDQEKQCATEIGVLDIGHRRHMGHGERSNKHVIGIPKRRERERQNKKEARVKPKW